MSETQSTHRAARKASEFAATAEAAYLKAVEEGRMTESQERQAHNHFDSAQHYAANASTLEDDGDHIGAESCCNSAQYMATKCIDYLNSLRPSLAERMAMLRQVCSTCDLKEFDGLTEELSGDMAEEAMVCTIHAAIMLAADCLEDAALKVARTWAAEELEDKEAK